MSEIEKQIQNQLKTIKQKYLNDPAEIKRDFNIEQKTAGDYKGREIYELLQNAEDAANGEGEVLIEFRGDKFSISNTGKPFDLGGLESLLKSDISPKKSQLNMIGQKGLGFRSVLTWVSKIRVLSENFSLEFSKENAREFLRDFKFKDKIQNIAILPCPKIIRKKPQSPFATTIELVCKNSYLDDIKRQIENLDMFKLLFLKKLKSVRIRTDEFDKTFLKKLKNKIEIVEFDNLTNAEISSSKWHLFTRDGEFEIIDDDKEKRVKYEMKIAYDFDKTIDFNTHQNYLYSYFKTQIPLKFPCLIHATFALISNRNALQQDEVNAWLMEELADFIADTAVKISKMQKGCDYEPLKLVLAGDKGEKISGYSLYEMVREKARQKPIFPTIAGEFITLDNYCFSHLNFAEILNKNTFTNLLQYSESEAIRKFIGHRFYTYESFVECLNWDIEQGFYNIEQKCELIKLVKDNQRFFNDFSGAGLNLLVDDKGNVAKNELFVKPENEINLPNFVNSISFLHPKMQEILGENLDLGQSYENFGLKNYDFVTIFEKVLKDLNDNKSKKNVIEFLKWAFKIFKQKEIEIEESDEIPLICENGEILNANECYFGAQFKNEFGEKIISTFSKNFIKNLREFKDKNKDEVIEFYEWCGVAKFPRISVCEIKNDECKGYLDYIFEKDKYIIPDSHNEEITRDLINGISKAMFDKIEHLDEILANLDFESIIRWYFLDKNLQNRIKENSKDSYLSCYIRQKINRREFKKLPSFIKYKFSRAKWLNDKEISPSQCCLEKLNLEPLLWTPKIDYKKFEKKSKKDINGALKKLGVAEHFTDLPIKKQYEILAKLHEIPQGIEVARKVYDRMLENEDSIDISSKKDFIKNGRVLVKQNGEKFFANINEAFFAPKGKFSENILKKYPIFDIKNDAKIDEVREIFGVSPLNLEVKLENFESVNENLQGEFNKDFEALKPYILVFRKDLKSYNEDLKKTKNAKIKLVKNLSLSYDESVEEVQDYEYFKDENIVYVKVPELEFSNLKKNNYFASILADALCEMLWTNKKYREFIKADESERNELIKIEKGEEILEILKEIQSEFNEQDEDLDDEFEVQNEPKISSKNSQNKPEIKRENLSQNEFKNSQNKQTQNKTQSEKINTGREFTHEKQEVNLIKNLPQLNLQDFSIEKIETKKPDLQIKTKNPSTNSPKKEPSQITSQSNKDEIGRQGELLVYEHLSQKYEVKWLSNNAKKCGKTDQADDNCGYDMHYFNENGEQIFVEVKTSNAQNTDKFEFYISQNELDCALEKGKFYEIYFVQLENKSIKISQNLFKNEENLFKALKNELEKSQNFSIKIENFKVLVEFV